MHCTFSMDLHESWQTSFPNWLGLDGISRGDGASDSLLLWYLRFAHCLLPLPADVRHEAPILHSRTTSDSAAGRAIAQSKRCGGHVAPGLSCLSRFSCLFGPYGRALLPDTTPHLVPPQLSDLLQYVLGSEILISCYTNPLETYRCELESLEMGIVQLTASEFHQETGS